MGFVSPEAQRQGRAALEAAGLTNPRKQNIAAAKAARAQALLAEQFCRTCGDPDCARLAATPPTTKEHVTVAPAFCTICHGSGQQRAARLLAAALQGVNRTNVLVLGGTPQQHVALRDLLAGTPIVLRAVDGSTRAHSAAEAAPQLAWAHLLVVWASTPLHHKVSVAYTSQAPAALPVITIAKRGVESLCRGIAERVGSLARR